jgi:hypothetical protein
LVSIMGDMRPIAEHRYQVDLVFASKGQRRTRRLQHDDCTQLSQGAALVMALVIDPERARLPASESTPPEAPRDATQPTHDRASGLGHPRLSVPSKTMRVAPGQRSSHPRWNAALGVMVQSGILPTAEPGLAGELSAVPMPALRLGITANYGLPSRTTFDAPSGAQAEFTQWAAGALGCWQDSRRWHWAVCGHAEFGRIRGQGRHVAEPQTRTDGYAAVLSHIEGGHALTHWLRVQLTVGGGVLLARPRYEVEGFGEVHRPAFWLLRGTAGVAVTVP